MPSDHFTIFNSTFPFLYADISLARSNGASALVYCLGQVRSKFCRLPQMVKRGLFHGRVLVRWLRPSGLAFIRIILGRVF